MDDWQRVTKPKLGESVRLSDDETEMKIIGINRYDVTCNIGEKENKTIKKWDLRYPRKEIK